MPVTPDMLYGHTDTIILRCLLDGESYGYEINRVIAEKSHQRFELKEATLYTAFRRLESEGCALESLACQVAESGSVRQNLRSQNL